MHKLNKTKAEALNFLKLITSYNEDKDNVVFGPLPEKKYEIIYLDPPWYYHSLRYKLTKEDKEKYKKFYTLSASTHYSCIKTCNLAKLDVPNLAAEDCLLFMWATNPHIQEAILLGYAWGFQYVTVGFVWNKKTPLCGFYTMSQCELCLIFKKGKIPKPRGITNARQYIEEKRNDHSAKPEEARKRIDLMFPEQKKIELFARKKVEGWDCWGKDVEPEEVKK